MFLCKVQSQLFLAVGQSLVTIEKNGGNDGHHSDIEYLASEQSLGAFDEVDDK